MCRHIQPTSLDYARYSKNPWGGKPKRMKRVARLGLAYEKKVEKELARRGLDFARGPWIEFADRNGRGFAQPDFVIYSRSDLWIVLEAKLSQTPAAFEQLFKLYLPLLRKMHPEVELIPAQVCKNLKKRDVKIVDCLEKVKYGSTWHWLH